jgi:hypothetical protein
MKLHKIFTILFLLTLCSCESREEKIMTNWKYVEGFHFGDFLSFQNQKIRITNDTIYDQSTPIAIIKEFKTTYFPGTENKLILQDIGSGKLGTYTDKGK